MEADLGFCFLFCLNIWGMYGSLHFRSKTGFVLGLVLWCCSWVSVLVFSFAQRKRELVALLRVLCLFLAVHIRLQCVIVAGPITFW